MRTILSIEYNYVRVYINSVALQAIVEHRDHPVDHTVIAGNREAFVQAVTASRAILITVVDELLPADQLKHVPIRTYSRIVAGAMFCLKVRPAAPFE